MRGTLLHFTYILSTEQSQVDQKPPEGMLTSVVKPTLTVPS